MGTWEETHVQWSESRFFMTLAMAGTMGLVMLGWMLNMYNNTKVNGGIVIAAALGDRTDIDAILELATRTGEVMQSEEGVPYASSFLKVHLVPSPATLPCFAIRSESSANGVTVADF